MGKKNCNREERTEKRERIKRKQTTKNIWRMGGLKKNIYKKIKNNLTLVIIIVIIKHTLGINKKNNNEEERGKQRGGVLHSVL